LALRKMGFGFDSRPAGRAKTGSRAVKRNGRAGVAGVGRRKMETREGARRVSSMVWMRYGTPAMASAEEGVERKGELVRVAARGDEGKADAVLLHLSTVARRSPTSPSRARAVTRPTKDGDDGEDEG
jgi:hypothetical protein